MNHSVYLVTNNVNGKVYVGQTVDPAGRWGAHKGKGPKSRSLISLAVKKYGHESFSFEVLHGNLDKAQADFFEIHYISVLCADDHDFGYNIVAGGGGVTRKFCKRGHARTAPGSCPECVKMRVYRPRTPEQKLRGGEYAKARNKRLRAQDPEWAAARRAESKASYARAKADPVLLAKRRAEGRQWQRDNYVERSHERHVRNYAELKADPVAYQAFLEKSRNYSRRRRAARKASRLLVSNPKPTDKP